MYDDPECFASEVVNHAVLLVGYNLVADQRYWIIRNSWGTYWGLGGYMHLGMAGGDGVCGINVLPGLMLVIKFKGRSSSCFPTVTSVVVTLA